MQRFLRAVPVWIRSGGILRCNVTRVWIGTAGHEVWRLAESCLWSDVVHSIHELCASLSVADALCACIFGLPGAYSSVFRSDH